jgi:hypothetical protein
MFCSMCGAENSNDGNFCLKCGAVLQGQKGMPAPGVHFEAPPPQPYLGPAQTSGKAIASLICGILFFLLPSAIAAIILGHLSLSDIRRAGGRLKGHGLAVTGLVLGYGGVAVIPLILIVAAVAIPNFLRARIAANEASAVGSLRTVETVAIEYHETYSNGYPVDLEMMGSEGSAGATCDHPQLIDPALASGNKNGYNFSFAATYPVGFVLQPPPPVAAANGCTTAGGPAFEAHADPATRGTSGQRSFFADESGIIRFETDAPATADSAPLE